MKVCGRATYISDVDLPNMLYAMVVCNTIAAGRVTSLEFAAAQAMPGVRLILHRGNIGKLYRIPGNSFDDGFVDDQRPPFEDDVIRYYGQYVACVIANTFEAANAAVHAVKVGYEVASHDVSDELGVHEKLDVHSERGDAATAFDQAAVKIDQTYATPVETHNPIELHATVVHWNGDSYTFYETSQAVTNYRGTLQQMLGVPKEKVRVISRYLGSGFGGKLWIWPHSLLAGMATKQTGQPVKLVVSRKMMFQNVGHRPTTEQRVRLGATKDDKLVSDVGTARLSESCGHRQQLFRGLRRSHAASLQRKESTRDRRHREAQRRFAHRDVRTRRGARPVRARIRDERACRRAQYRSGGTASAQRAEGR